MLEGRNTLTLNQATMRKALQHYFDTVLFAPDKSPTVVEVRSTGSNNFEVETNGERVPT